MTLALAILVFLAYHGLNVFLGWQNKQVVQKRLNHKDLRQIEHFWWALAYCIGCSPMYWCYNLWFAIAILFPHLSIFGPAYNLYRGFAAFNLSKTSKATTEMIMVRIGLKDTETVCIIAEVIAVILFTISFLKYEHII